MKDLGNTVANTVANSVANPRCHRPVRPASRHATAIAPFRPAQLPPQGRHDRAALRLRAVWRRRAGAAVPLLLAIVAAVALA